MSARRRPLGSRRGQAHDYTSTACHHELHEECRRTCKWCEAPCQCACHGGGDRTAIHVPTPSGPRGSST